MAACTVVLRIAGEPGRPIARTSGRGMTSVCGRCGAVYWTATGRQRHWCETAVRDARRIVQETGDAR